MKTILKQLINIRSAQPEGNEAEVITYINQLLPKQYARTLFDHGSGRQSLLVKVAGKTDVDGVAFLGHIDTVNAGVESDWTYPPYTATEVDGRIYGRGSADMKSGVAAMLYTALQLQNDPPVYNTYFGFTADEEAGGLGVVAMAQSGLLQNVKAVVVCEPSDGRVGTCEKGALWLQICAAGRLSHGSRPDLGVNALQGLVDFLHEFDSRVDYSVQSPHFGGTTVALTMLNGGVLHNVVPDRAKMCLDIRTVFGVNHSDLVSAAQAAADAVSAQTHGLVFDIQVTNDRPPVATDEDAALVQAAKRLAVQNGLTGETRGLYFYTDASQLIPAINKPFVIFGPGDDKLAHQQNEWVAASDLDIFANIYLGLTREENL